MIRAYVALGANLGDPVATVRSAIDGLRRMARSTLVAVSPLYRTAPVGLANQPDFINGVAALDTLLSPDALLQALFAIEALHGRTREIPPRDAHPGLDLLLYGDLTRHDPHLVLPHPRMHERAFVLMPLGPRPQLEIPGRGTVGRCWRRCRPGHRTAGGLTCPPFRFRSSSRPSVCWWAPPPS